MKYGMYETYEITFCFCLMQMAKTETQKLKCMCSYAYMHTRTHTHSIFYHAHLASSDLLMQIHSRESQWQKKEKRKGKFPTEENLSKKRLAERTSRETQGTRHCQEIIHFQNSRKGFKGVLSGVQFISFSTMTISVELPSSIPQLCMINLLPHAIMFHSPSTACTIPFPVISQMCALA